jgi:hypothetical protein
MSSITRTTPSLTAFSDVKGRIITSDNPSYDQARAVFYGGIGHSVSGHSTTDGGVVFDLRDMCKIEIDADDRRIYRARARTA